LVYSLDCAPFARVLVFLFRTRYGPRLSFFDVFLTFSHPALVQTQVLGIDLDTSLRCRISSCYLSRFLSPRIVPGSACAPLVVSGIFPSGSFRLWPLSSYTLFLRLRSGFLFPLFSLSISPPASPPSAETSELLRNQRMRPYSTPNPPLDSLSALLNLLPRNSYVCLFSTSPTPAL